MRRAIRKSLTFVGICIGIVVLVVGFSKWTAHKREVQDLLDDKLLLSAQRGNVDEVKTLLEQGADPNTRKFMPAEVTGIQGWFSHSLGLRLPEERTGRSVLGVAGTGKNPYPVLQLLLAHGADLKATEHGSDLLLFRAARHGDLATTQLLLDHGADINQGTGLDRPLMGAMLARNKAIIDLLRARGATLPAGVTLASAKAQESFTFGGTGGSGANMPRIGQAPIPMNSTPAGSLSTPPTGQLSGQKPAGKTTPSQGSLR